MSSTTPLFSSFNCDGPAKALLADRGPVLRDADGIRRLCSPCAHLLGLLHAFGMTGPSNASLFRRAVEFGVNVMPLFASVLFLFHRDAMRIAPLTAGTARPQTVRVATSKVFSAPKLVVGEPVRV
jgi:hypothetical protein